MINALLFAGADPNQAPPEDALQRLRSGIRPTLEDAGLSFERIERQF